MNNLLGTYICSPDDQELFAQLSGDHNPLHTNNLKSRRYLFGRTVMHGIHILFRGLDFFFNNEKTQSKLAFISASFLSPVYINDEIEYIINRNDEGVTINVYKEKESIADITFDIVTYKKVDFDFNNIMHNQNAKSLNESQIEKKSGALPLSIDKALFNKMFPDLSEQLHIGQVCGLLCSTRLIGMECPGLNSIYSELNFTSNNIEEKHLNYAVEKFKKRYKLVKLKINSHSLEGNINAFYRPLPEAQKAFKEVKSSFSTLRFKFKKALIVGGSRGVGEACAKLLAANNVEVIVSYNKGFSEANALVKEIIHNNGKAKCIAIDVLKEGELPDDASNIDALFYFASPPIFVAKKGEFNSALFDHFNLYYINGFLNVFNTLDHNKLNTVFYPSSIAIDENPLFMGEYVSSKLAGEGLCSFLSKKHNDICFLYPRLPRLASDQTVSLLPVKNTDPIEYLWGVFHDNLQHDEI